MAGQKETGGSKKLTDKLKLKQGRITGQKEAVGTEKLMKGKESMASQKEG
jgi:hypothetical protein